MGCDISRSADPSPVHTPDRVIPGILSLGVENFAEFKVTSYDLITERSGKVTEDYEFFTPPLGQGAFGEVRKAQNKQTGLLRAIKIINKNQTKESDQERLINEVDILRKLDHPNIMKIYEFYQDDINFYIVNELYTGGELFEKVTKLTSFDEKLAAETMKQILSAVFYCHRNKIVHRDLKPENCVLNLAT